MNPGNVATASIVATVVFIFSLGGLSGQENAKRAVWYGIVGMAIAVLATILGPGVGKHAVVLPMIAVGAAVGWYVAARVQMTGMPQLVAALHSFVGLSAISTGSNADIEFRTVQGLDAVGRAALVGLWRTMFERSPLPRDSTTRAGRRPVWIPEHRPLPWCPDHRRPGYPGIRGATLSNCRDGRP
ncbi:NAD(P)(+) transhydrogenase (Re/Si-specific) subunit beta [Methylobacterium amylolyticum]|uniref:NAD(P)(+) transhydrogenase (Re/Si-specific) subunit beta n=1 Tax=Methylobacterium sp. NEAU 140 TaxID=3064945 RepID=UPI0035202D52